MSLKARMEYNGKIESIVQREKVYYYGTKQFERFEK